MPRDAQKLAFVTQTTLSRRRHRFDRRRAAQSGFRASSARTRKISATPRPIVRPPSKPSRPRSAACSSSAARRVPTRCGWSRSHCAPAAPRRCSSSAPPTFRGTTLDGSASVGVTAGASAPEIIVEEVVDAFRDRFDVTYRAVTTLEERVVFNVPREFRPVPRLLTPAASDARDMAVYTEVSDEELARFIAGYGLGDCSRSRASPKASRTPTILCTPAGTFILTLYEKRVEVAICRSSSG